MRAPSARVDFHAERLRKFMTCRFFIKTSLVDREVPFPNFLATSSRRSNSSWHLHPARVCDARSCCSSPQGGRYSIDALLRRK